MKNYFEDKVCVVTGAASGIGLAVAKMLLERGARVTFADVDEANLKKVQAEVGDSDRTRFVVTDVADLASVENMIRVGEELGEIDILFNNAGICRGMLYEQSTPEMWRNILDINVMGVAHGIHCVMQKMIKRGKGQIVNTSSISGLVPTPFESMYTATKFAVVGLTEALRYEFARYGITFSVVCPSDVRTPIYDHAVYYNGKILPGGGEGLKMVNVDDAAQIILDGVEKKTPIIIVGETGEQFLKMYRAPDGDERMTAWTSKRIESLAQLLH